VVLPIIRSLSRAKWLNPVTLAELQADLRARDANPLSLAPMTTAAAREALGPRFTTPMRVSQQRLTGLADIVDTPATVTEPYSLALIRTGSAAWREDRTEGIEFVNTVTTQLINKLNSVHVLPGGVKNLSSENIDIPITIANELPVPVTVGLRLTSNPKVRLSADPVPATTIPANRKVSISVPARVLGSGPIDATAQLLTPEGKAYGRPVSLTLANSTYSQVATWVVTAAFVILVGLLTVNSVRRRRETRRSGDDVAEPEDD
jgi:hypothetical protein